MTEAVINFRSHRADALHGKIRVPGDKSISHRSIILGSIAEGRTTVSGFLDGADCLATASAFRAMGVAIDTQEDGVVVVEGVGLHGLSGSKEPLDMGNSGTSIRLLSGLLAGQNFSSELVGDRSLSVRPMSRVIKPLAQMGADISATTNNTAPLKINPSKQLQAIHYDLPVASAQVKSAILLAGLYANGETSVKEPEVTRDHTERMLRGFGYSVAVQGDRISLAGGGVLHGTEIDVPADISSAAFFMVAASIVPDADILLEHVGINPTRTGVIDILKLMGARIDLENPREVGGEPVADIRVRSAKLHGIKIPSELVPLAIDEFPVVFVAAAVAAGTTTLRDAAELRVKESDRIQVMADGLIACGIDCEVLEDGIIIAGGQLSGGKVHSRHDHRIAMAFAVAGLCSNEPIVIQDCANVSTSFPGFLALASGLGFNLEQENG